MDIQKLRGSETSDIHILMTLVRAPLQLVAETLTQIKQVKHWYTDVYATSVDIPSQGLILIQFKGHPWTIIRYLKGQTYSGYEEDAKLLSKELASQALYYFNCDTSGELVYKFYDNGLCQEEMICSHDEDLTFRSSLTSTEKEDMGSPYLFTEDFLVEQDIYIPAIWIPDLSPMSGKNFQDIKLEFFGFLPNSLNAVKFERSYFERVDYFSIS
ncbi:hypothetical protein SPB21_24510 [Leptothoe sp. ISB3NOV94-8A]|nr:hypothetical protein [Adonisia turfae]